MKTLANHEGRILPLEEVRISPLDRGFLFGDSVYEVLRIYQGKAWLEKEHFDRLERSLKEIRIEGVDIDRLRKRMHETISAGPYHDAQVYLQITRGAAPRRSHPIPKGIAPLELLWVEEIGDPYAAHREPGVRVITQPDLRWRRCDIKSTNLLGNILATTAAKEADCSEAILYRPDGVVTEATHSSFFGVKEGAIVTTPQSGEILPGITRSFLFQLTERAKIPVREEVLRLEALPSMDETFLTGTTSEVLPIVEIDGKSVGSGKPGPVTRKLQAAYREAVAEFLLG